MCRFRLHRFKSFVVLFTISSMCWLKESLLSRITPIYLSDFTSSRTMEFVKVSCRGLECYLLLLRFVVGVWCLKVR